MASVTVYHFFGSAAVFIEFFYFAIEYGSFYIYPFFMIEKIIIIHLDADDSQIRYRITAAVGNAFYMFIRTSHKVDFVLLIIDPAVFTHTGHA